uniref:Ubiquitin-like domain-containing protein n=1 Tax=Meloidogyne hapla TaxID=6305 RepID=A0A1I8BSA8_MELHA
MVAYISLLFPIIPNLELDERAKNVKIQYFNPDIKMTTYQIANIYNPKVKFSFHNIERRNAKYGFEVGYVRFSVGISKMKKKQRDPHCLFSLILTIVIFCVWESTSVSSNNSYFNSWVVLLRNSRRRSVLVIPIGELDTLNTTDSTDSSSTPNTPESLASEESSDQSGDASNRCFVVQAPSTTLSISPQLLSAILNHNSFSTMNSQPSNEQEREEQASPPASEQVNESSQNDENNMDNNPPNLSADSICIRIKFLDDSLKIVHSNKNVSIGIFKRQHFSEELKSGKIIRLIFQGRLLRDDQSTLEHYGLTDQCVLHCHIGTRPYNTNNAGNDTNRAENAQNGEAPSNSPGILGGGPRMIETGFWLILFNFVLSYVWNLVRIVWEWANRQEEEVAPTGTVSSFLFHLRQRIRRFFSVFLDILVGPAFVRQETQQHRHPDDNRYNIGNLMALIVFVKFLLLWSFVLVYPQFTDRRSLFFLSMLTSTSGLYFYFSRANALQRQRRSN